MVPQEITVPSTARLVDTLLTTELVSAFSRKRKLCDHVFPEIYKNKVPVFEASQANFIA